MTQNITSIDDLLGIDIENVDIDYADYKPEDIVLDLSIPLRTRISTFEKLEPNDMMEYTLKLAGMYTASHISLLTEYLQELCEKSHIPTELKIILVKVLLTSENEKAYEILDVICKNLVNIPTPIKIEIVCMLMKCDVYKFQAKKYFLQIINDMNIENAFRYKTILSLEHVECEFQKYFLTHSCMAFLQNNANMTMYRILAAQYLLLHCDSTQNQFKPITVEKYLLGFAEDTELDYNLRADAADCLLRSNSPDMVTKAQNIILYLGGMDAKTIYDNAQNVHTDIFEQSVLDALEFLNDIPIMKLENGSKINFEYVQHQIMNMMDKDRRETDEEYDKECKMVELSLVRINFDRVLYSRYNCTLVHILLLVWTYLESHENNNEMQLRLYEELLDMSGTCSTGFASRLVNVIAGFGDFNFKISWEEQIVSNFIGRLNAKARSIIDTWKDIEYVEYIVEILLKDYILKLELLREYIYNLNSIGNDLQNKLLLICEFKKGVKSSSYYIDKITEIQTLLKRYDLLPNISTLTELFLSCNHSYAHENNLKNETDLIDFMVKDFQMNVLAEMALAPSKYTERDNFLTFFRESMLEIREEMYEEFKDHMEDADFDLYIRKGIYKYDMGG